MDCCSERCPSWPSSSNPHPLAVSSVVAADSLPWLLLALPAGAFADRFARGPLMAISNLARALAILVGAFLILSDRMTLAILIVVVLINAGGRAMYYSAAQAIVPELVRSDALEHANGVLSGTEAGAEQLAGPVVGTWLFAMSKAIPFFADAVVTVLSCIPLVGFRSKSAATRGVLDLGVGGCPAPLRRPPAAAPALDGGLAWPVSRGWRPASSCCWRPRMGGSGGRLRALPGRRRGGEPRREPVGKPVGPPFRERPNPDRRRARVRRRLPDHGRGARLAAGRPRLRPGRLAIGAGSVVAISLRQRLTPPDLMGRVGGAWRGLVWGAAPLGALVAGGLAAIVGLRFPWCSPGRCSVRWGSCSPARFSTASGRVASRTA